MSHLYSKMNKINFIDVRFNLGARNFIRQKKTTIRYKLKQVTSLDIGESFITVVMDTRY